MAHTRHGLGLAVGVLVLAVCVRASNVVVDKPGLTVEYLGSSTKFRLTYPNVDRVYTLEFDELQELTSGGVETPNKVTNLASQAVVVHPPVMYDPDRNVTMVRIQGTLAVAASVVPFESRTLVTDQTYVVNGTVVPQFSFKFTLELGAWPFLAPTNRLRFATILKTRTGSAVDASESGVAHSFDLPDNDVYVFEDLVSLDGIPDFPILSTSTELSGNKRTFYVTFPAYTTRLYYDPYLAFDVASSESAFPGWILAVIVLGSVGAIVAILVWLVCRAAAVPVTRMGATGPMARAAIGASATVSYVAVRSHE